MVHCPETLNCCLCYICFSRSFLADPPFSLVLLYIPFLVLLAVAGHALDRVGPDGSKSVASRR